MTSGAFVLKYVLWQQCEIDRIITCILSEEFSNASQRSMTAELKLRHRIWIILIRKHATRRAYTHRFLSSGHIADMEENFFLQAVLHFCDEGRSNCTSCILPKANTILAQTTARLRQRPELSSRRQREQWGGKEGGSRWRPPSWA
jgi:hypothetical protein